MRHLFVVEDQDWLDIEVNCNEKLAYRSVQLSVFTENDYVEENKELLVDWLTHYNQFPLTAFVSVYQGMDEEIEAQLNEWQTEFSKVVKASEKKPVYIIQLTEKIQLIEMVSAFFWLPAQNEMMIITNRTAVIELLERRESEKSRYTYLGAAANLVDDCTIIDVSHDGQGFSVVTTDQALLSAKGIRESIPSHYVIEQRNDDVLL